MLLVFLFNMGGYYLLFWGLRTHSEKALQLRLDAENYSVNETITLRIPITVPYQIETRYERVYGEFEHKGEFFRLVKQRLEKDTLYIVCFKDHQEKRLFNTMVDFAKLSNDLPATSTALKLLASMFKEYRTVRNIKIPQPERFSTNFFIQPSSKPLDQFLTVASPPPERIG